MAKTTTAVATPEVTTVATPEVTVPATFQPVLKVFKNDKTGRAFISIVLSVNAEGQPNFQHKLAASTATILSAYFQDGTLARAIAACNTINAPKAAPKTTAVMASEVQF